jgi:hypothetical protein
MLNEAFATAVEASVYGLKRGKQWIDEKLAASKALKAGGAVK